MCAVRSAAHVLDRAVLGSVEFTVTDLGVPLVVVLGHDDCRAVATAAAAVSAGEQPAGTRGYVVDEIRPAVDGPGADLSATIEAHVRRTVERLRGSEVLAGPVREGRLDVVGGVYRLATGQVDFL